ncbi:[GSEE] tandem repeats [Invertebrate iridescent virus 22]|uniref:[GSEE] tandem repeats n=1 Tax=Invertebrate iridescent virus 22 TaxID=345198 RepID=S6DAX9_9VIRU|nr:[GSEE] tandem repeats [Invertebrate iridescent virus 22]CCV01766.1 [GSEE] tandem repeats [Invertebrate iridescent virus 22]
MYMKMYMKDNQSDTNDFYQWLKDQPKNKKITDDIVTKWLETQDLKVKNEFSEYPYSNVLQKYTKSTLIILAEKTMGIQCTKSTLKKELIEDLTIFFRFDVCKFITLKNHTNLLNFFTEEYDSLERKNQKKINSFFNLKKIKVQEAIPKCLLLKYIFDYLLNETFEWFENLGIKTIPMCKFKKCKTPLVIIKDSTNDSDGSEEGESDGSEEGESDGSEEGESDGSEEGESDGSEEGESDGSEEGESDGSEEGESDGSEEGESDGSEEGESDNE